MNLTHLWLLVPVALACVVGVVLFTILTRRRAKRFKLPKGAKRDNWDEHEDSFADRRNSLRREGQPVRIHLASPTIRGGQDEGFVLDRSTGGLRVAVQVPIPAGTMVQVKAANAPDTVPWVTIVVRSCRNGGEHYELGCEFDRTPPWNVLLLFG